MPEEQPMVQFKDVEKVYRGENVAVEGIEVLTTGQFQFVDDLLYARFFFNLFVDKPLNPSEGCVVFLVQAQINNAVDGCRNVTFVFQYFIE